MQFLVTIVGITIFLSLLFFLLLYIFFYYSPSPNLITKQLKGFGMNHSKIESMLSFIFLPFFKNLFSVFEKSFELCFGCGGKTNSLLCGDNYGGSGYVCVSDCIACHICFPSWGQSQAPPWKQAVEISYPNTPIKFKPWMWKRSCFHI